MVLPDVVYRFRLAVDMDMEKVQRIIENDLHQAKAQAILVGDNSCFPDISNDSGGTVVGGVQSRLQVCERKTAK
jgi:hypothetical protein